jgi:hypothetical protein
MVLQRAGFAGQSGSTHLKIGLLRRSDAIADKSAGFYP